MTLFVFLSAAAGAGIIASNLVAFAFHLLRLCAVAAVAALLRHHEFGAPPLALHLLGLFLFLDRLEKEEESQRVFLNAPHQTLEKQVRLFLVFHQRVTLAVAAQADAFLE